MAKLTYNIPKDYTVIDLETTGTSPAKSEIIEIACLKYRNGEQVEAIQQLVQRHFGQEMELCGPGEGFRILFRILLASPMKWWQMPR